MATLISLRVVPLRTYIPVGGRTGFVTIGTYDDGTTAIIATGLTYVSSDPAYVSISGSGALGVSDGWATVTITHTATGLHDHCIVRSIPDLGSQLYQKADTKVRVTKDAVTKILTDICEISIDLIRNEPMKWTIVLNNQDRKYSTKNSGSTFYEYLNPKKTTAWEINVKTKGNTSETEERSWAYLCPMDYNLSSTVGGNVVAVSGVDYSYKLSKNNQTKATQRSTAVDVKNMKDVLTSILEEYGVAHHYTDMHTPPLNLGDELENYTVKWLHFQGEIPLDVIKRLLAIKWASFEMIDNTFYAYMPDYDKTSYPLADYIIEDILTIESLGYSLRNWDTITRVVVRRTSEAGAVLFEDEGNDTTSHIVEGNLSAFPDGGINPTIAISQAGGEIKEIYFFSEPGGGGAVGSGERSVPSPSAKSMSFFFQPTLGKTAWWYHIVVKAEKPVAGEETSLIEDYCVKYKNETLEAELGDDIPGVEEVIEDLIPTKAMAMEYAIRYLQNAARRYETVNITCGLHIGLRPGHTIAIKECGSVLDKECFFVEAVRHNIVQGTTEITALKYRQADSIVAYT